MKFLKKNQVLVYVIAFMLVTAGYLNYTAKEHDTNDLLQTTTSVEELAGTNNIGDARLVSGQITEGEQTNTQASEENKDINGNQVRKENESSTENKDNMANQEDNVSKIEKNEGENKVEEQNGENSVNKNEGNYTDNSVTTSANQTKNDYFSKSKLERDTMYSQMIETYEKVLNGINSLETQKQSAAQEIKKINDTKNSIMICENLITTKGFENNVIFVNGESVSAIIGATELKPEEVAQIQNILSRELNAKIENIHIAVK